MCTSYLPPLAMPGWLIGRTISASMALRQLAPSLSFQRQITVHPAALPSCNVHMYGSASLREELQVKTMTTTAHINLILARLLSSKD